MSGEHEWIYCSDTEFQLCSDFKKPTDGSRRWRIDYNAVMILSLQQHQTAAQSQTPGSDLSDLPDEPDKRSGAESSFKAAFLMKKDKKNE